MAVETSTVPAVLDMLKALLDARKAEGGNALVGVEVLTAPSGEPAPLESVEFLGVADNTHSWKALGGRRREERYTLDGAILVTKAGAGEAIAKEARDRAYAIAAEVQDVIWANASLKDIATRTDIQYASGQLRQGWQDTGRIADLPFTVSIVSILER